MNSTTGSDPSGGCARGGATCWPQTVTGDIAGWAGCWADAAAATSQTNVARVTPGRFTIRLFLGGATEPVSLRDLRRWPLVDGRGVLVILNGVSRANRAFEVAPGGAPWRD